MSVFKDFQMHDLDRMKAKVEIRLGATQSLRLHGTAVFSALLFVAGYTVGKSFTHCCLSQIQRVLSGVSEERAVSRLVAAMGEVEFMFRCGLT